MLNNAKEMRKNYIERVKEAADDIINVINCLEETNFWEAEMGEKGYVDILLYIDGTDDYAEEKGVDIEEVYKYLETVVDPSISPKKTVIEALEEIFDIEYDSESFELYIKPYDSEIDN